MTMDDERRALKQDRRRVRSLLSNYEGSDRSLEWFSSAVMIAWCVSLALPGNLLSQPVFGQFLRYGLTEMHWVVIFGLVGSCRLAALYINGRWPRGYMVRVIGAGVGAIIWLPISIMLTQGALQAYHSLSPGTGVYALLAFAEIIAIRRAAHDVRYYSR